MSRRTESNPVTLLPALRTHLWFGSCPEVLQTALVERARLVHLTAGEALREDAQDGLCCVIAGALRMGSAHPEHGTQRLTLYVEPYHWFGEVSLIDRMPRAMTAVADTDSTVLIVPKALLDPWLDANPVYWRDLARLACGKLRLMTAALEDSASLTLQQRLARRLLFSAVNYGQSAQSGLRRRLRLPQEYLAQMMGVSRQTVNKALRDLEREQVLALHYAEIELLSLEGLLARSGRLDSQLRFMLAGAAPGLLSGRKA
jgi:CRP-like cAMP-binding protein